MAKPKVTALNDYGSMLIEPDRLPAEAVLAVACSEVLFTDRMDVALDRSLRRFLRVEQAGPGEYAYTYVGPGGYEKAISREDAVLLLAASIEGGS